MPEPPTLLFQESITLFILSMQDFKGRRKKAEKATVQTAQHNTWSRTINNFFFFLNSNIHYCKILLLFFFSNCNPLLEARMLYHGHVSNNSNKTAALS